MLPKIDTQTIRDSVSLAAVVGQDVDLQFAAGGRELRGPCPFCEDGRDRFAVFTDSRLFNCRQCGRKGDVIEYFALRNGLDFLAAAKRLQGADLPDLSGDSLASGRKNAQDASEGELRVEWENRLEMMVIKALDHLVHVRSDGAAGARRWLADRGIQLDQIEAFGIGYNDHWRTIVPGYKLPPGIVLPRWAAGSGAIAAVNVYLARDARKSTGQRRMYVKGSKPKQTMFNAFRIGDDHDQVVVCEGELDAVLLSRFLPPFALPVATGGAEMVSDDLAVLVGKRVVLVLDNDEAGRHGVERWLEMLPEATVVTVSEGKDATDFWKAGGDLDQWVKGIL